VNLIYTVTKIFHKLNAKKGVSLFSKLFERLPLPIGNIIGHRGIAGRAPENTLAGFNAAAHFGLNWVEFDIQRCTSGEWVLFHDETLERTTNGQGRLKDTPYEILKTLDAGTWFHPQYKNEKIPTLQEALSCLAALKIHPNIEIKVFPQDKAQVKIVDKFEDKRQMMIDLLKSLQAMWPNTLPPPLVSSFDLESLKILKSLDRTLPLGYVVQYPTKNTLNVILQEKFDSLHCDHLNLSSALLAQLTSKLIPVPVLAYTVNNPERLKTLLESGIRAVFSDITEIISL
jgi:glycerophosphoryl diester phosphodiesterase